MPDSLVTVAGRGHGRDCSSQPLSEVSCMVRVQPDTSSLTLVHCCIGTSPRLFDLWPSRDLGAESCCSIS